MWLIVVGKTSFTGDFAIKQLTHGYKINNILLFIFFRMSPFFNRWSKRFVYKADIGISCHSRRPLCRPPAQIPFSSFLTRIRNSGGSIDFG